MDNPEPNRRRNLFFIFLGLTVASAVLASGSLSGHGAVRLFAWAAGGSAVLAFMASLGVSPWRALLDDYNRGNLQHAITAGWFVLLSSALLTVAFVNVFAWTPTPGIPVPLFVRIDASIWVLAGIALGGFALNRAIDGAHAAAAPPNAAAEAAWNAQADRVGRMFLRRTSGHFEAGQHGRNDSHGVTELPSTTIAMLADAVKGRQKGTEAHVDMGPTQQLMLQATTCIGYAVAVGMLLYATPSGQSIPSLPTLPAELLTLLGVSAVGQAALAALPASPS